MTTRLKRSVSLLTLPKNAKKEASQSTQITSYNMSTKSVIANTLAIDSFGAEQCPVTTKRRVTSRSAIPMFKFNGNIIYKEHELVAPIFT